MKHQIYRLLAIIFIALTGYSCIDSNPKYDEMVRLLEQDSISVQQQKMLMSYYDIDTISSISDDFFAEWQRASEDISDLYVNLIVDSLYQRVFEYFCSNSYPYVVISPVVAVGRYNTKYDENFYQSGDIFGLCRADLFHESVRHYMPHLRIDRPVLYLSEGIETKLSAFLGGIDDDTGMSRDRDRERLLAQYVDVSYGHWGGYWLLESMPVISSISIFKNGVFVCLRGGWNWGLEVFMPNDSDEFQVVSEWIE